MLADGVWPDGLCREAIFIFARCGAFHSFAALCVDLPELGQIIADYG